MVKEIELLLVLVNVSVTVTEADRDLLRVADGVSDSVGGDE